MSMRAGGAAVALALLVGPAHGADLTLGPRLEYKHVSRGHELHVSGAAVAARADGGPVVAWAAQEGHANQLYVLLPGEGATPGAVLVVAKGSQLGLRRHRAPSRGCQSRFSFARLSDHKR